MATDSRIERKLETHITLDVSCPTSIQQAGRWAAEQGLKWTHIVLPEGEHPSQPMLTFWQSGTLEGQLERARLITEAMRMLEVAVVRVKVECESEDAGRFFDDSQQLAEHPGYFEHHVKLRLANATKLDALEQLVRRYEARLSANARRQLADGFVERFVTQRAYASDQVEAAGRFASLRDAMEAVGYPILEVENEYVLYDSNLRLDAGWL